MVKTSEWVARVASTMDKVRVHIATQKPFFAVQMVQTPIEVMEVAPGGRRACTDMKTIFYRQSFVESLTFEGLLFVHLHELLHILLKHGLRMGNRDHKLWNQATDYAINSILKECGVKLIDDCLYDARFTGMAAEQIYTILYQEQQSGQGKPLSRLPKGQGVPAPQPSQPGQGQPQPGQQPGQGQPQPGDGDPIGYGDLLPVPGGEMEQVELARTIDANIMQGALMARQQGKLPAALERMIADVMTPQVPWQSVLREWMTATPLDDETWECRDRRYAHVYLPGEDGERLGEVIFIGDTSGSISSEELAQAGGEVIDIAHQLRPSRLRIVWADAKVASVQDFTEDDVQQLEPVGSKGPIALRPKGGGGTDMRIPLKHVEQYAPQVVILYTDGYTPWPTQEPPFPLIVVCTTNTPVPVGRVIRVNP